MRQFRYAFASVRPVQYRAVLSEKFELGGVRASRLIGVVCGRNAAHEQFALVSLQLFSNTTKMYEIDLSNWPLGGAVVEINFRILGYN